jgi:hypothetical protein
MSILESLETLSVSEECFKDIITLIEGKVIDFQRKRMDKVLDTNANRLAKMVRNGELNALRFLSNGELIGEPSAVKKVKEINQSNSEAMNRWLKYK